MAFNDSTAWFDSPAGEAHFRQCFFIPFYVSFGLFMSGILEKIKTRYKISRTFTLILTGFLYGILVHVSVPEQYVKNFVILNWSRFVTRSFYIPILLLSTMFDTNTRVFFRSMIQYMLIGFGGSVIMLFMTMVFLRVILKHGEEIWDWKDIAVLSISVNLLSAKSILSSLKNLDASAYLMNLVSGEAIFINLFALTTYEVIRTEYVRGFDCFVDNILPRLGGFVASPIFGYVTGKILIRYFKRFPPHVYTGTTLIIGMCLIMTIISDISTYTSAIFSSLVFALTLSSDKELIDAKLASSFKVSFKLMLLILDSVFFIAIGNLTFRITFQITAAIDADIWHKILYIYMALSVFRFISLIAISPFLYKLGYGMNWKYSAILIWSQFRDTTALLVPFDNYSTLVSSTDIAEQMILITIVIVIASQLINHLSVLYIVRFLGVDAISAARKRAMANAIVHIQDIVIRSINVHKKDFLMASAHWNWITQYTLFDDPYVSKFPQEREEQDYMVRFKLGRSANCPVCKRQKAKRMTIKKNVSHISQPGTSIAEEIQELKDEAYRRAINIAKVSYKEQSKIGLIESYICTRLSFLADLVLECPGRFIEYESIKNQLVVGKLYDKMKRWIDLNWPKLHQSKLEIDWKYAHGKHQERNLLYSQQRNAFHWFALNIVAHPRFDTVPLIRIVVGLVAFTIGHILNSIQFKYIRDFYVFENIIHVACIILFTFEILLKTIAFGAKVYWKNFTNKLDIIILCITLLSLAVLSIDGYHDVSYSKLHNILPLSSFLSSVHLLFIAITNLRNFFYNIYNEKLYKNYSFAKGFEIGQMFSLHKVRQITEYDNIIIFLQEEMHANLLQITQQKAVVFQKHPEIVIAAITHSVTRRLIYIAMTDLARKKNILFHEADYKALYQVLHHLQMQVLKAPPIISSSFRCVDIVCGSNWIDRRLYKYLQKYIIYETHESGTVLQPFGSKTKGVYIIKSGLIMVTGVPDNIKSDTLPSASSLLYLTAPPNENFVDYLIVTQTVGLLGVLTRSPLVTEAVCETDVETILIPTEAIYDIMSDCTERPTLLYCAWRHVSLKIAVPILVDLIHYSSVSKSNIRSMLLNAILPTFENCTEFRRTDNITDIILIQGIIEDPRTNLNYYGPTYIPRSVTTLHFQPKASRDSRIVVLLLANEHYELPEELDWAGHIVEKPYRKAPHRIQQQTSFVQDKETASSVATEEEEEQETMKELECYELFDDSFMHAPKVSPDALTMFRYEALEKEMALRI